MTEYLQANWCHPPQTERWLASMCIGETLNVCCGLSKVGDVRIDLLPLGNMRADLFNLPFKQQSFDTVICDPPFSYYNRFKWVLRLSDIAKKRILISSSRLQIKLGREWIRKVFISSFGMAIRLYWCFDKKEEE